MKKIILLCAICFFSTWLTAFANQVKSASTPNAKVYFISPTDGQTVQQTFKIQFGLSGMGVAPAGVQKEKTGHHHLLINTDISMINLNEPLPATGHIKHFGGGQTEANITLPPGQHTLQLLLGNYAHVPHSTPIISKKITVIVK